MYDKAELTVDGLTFVLDEFFVGNQGFNYHIKQSSRGTTYPEETYAFFYVTSKDEIELVKNFLTTIRS